MIRNPGIVILFWGEKEIQVFWGEKEIQVFRSRKQIIDRKIRM